MMVGGLARLLVGCVRRSLIVVLAWSCALALPAHAEDTTYTYDVHGRLKIVTVPIDSLDQSKTTYTYDNAGNRQSVVTSFIDRTPPNAPSGLSATALASDRIRLNWTTTTDVGGGPVSYYKLYRQGSNVASPSGPPFDDAPVGESTTYTYKVSAVDSAGNESAQSSSASATTPLGPDVAPPNDVQNLQGIPTSGTTVYLSWNPTTDNGTSGIAGYEVWKDSGGAPYASTASTNYTDTVGVASTHTYTVRAYDGAGNRSVHFSNQVSVTTPDTQPPYAPGVPTFSAVTATTATANWTAATDNIGVTGYRYYLATGAWNSGWIYPGNVLSANLAGLTLGTAYTMVVQALDAAGNWGSGSGGTLTTSSYYIDNLTLVGGAAGDGTTFTYGYMPAMGIGSLTPNTLTGGKTVTNYYSYYILYFDGVDWTIVGQSTVLRVTGFSSNPGANWLQGGSSAFFSCSGAECTWSWPYYSDLSGTQTVTIAHQ